MKYNVILEGCDCVGKTSVAAFFKQFEGAEVVHIRPPKSMEDAHVQYLAWVKLLNSRTGFVLDRAFLSECVYAPLKRGYFPKYMRELEKTLNSNTFVVLLDASPNTILKRFDGQFITEREIPVVLESYRKEMEASNYPRKLTVNVEGKTAYNVYGQVVNTIAKMRAKK
jgi:thymidylate kinase